MIKPYANLLIKNLAVEALCNYFNCTFEEPKNKMQEYTFALKIWKRLSYFPYGNQPK